MTGDLLERADRLEAALAELEAVRRQAGTAGRSAVAGDPARLASVLDTRYKRPPHVALLAEAVADTVASGGRLLVSMPPRAGKSATASLWTPVWFLAAHPDRSVILASHESNFAVSWGRRARNVWRQAYRRGVVPVDVAREVSAAGEWETTAGGGMLSRGIGAGITGRGADLLLVDDPVKDFASAHSRLVRDAQWEWWLSTALTRLEPGAAVVVTMTRWHEDDLAGRILSDEWDGDPNRWRVLRIPAIAEDDDVLGRPPGDPLLLASLDETPEEAAVRWQETRATVGPYVWSGLYQQRPSEPEGALLRRAWWHRYRLDGDDVVRPDGGRVPVSRLRVVQSWDLALKDTGDYTVGQVWGADVGDMFLLEQVRDRMDYPRARDAIRDVSARWPQAEAVLIEDAANGPAVMADLRREVAGMRPVTPRGSKVSRVIAVQGAVEAGNVWLPERAQWNVQALVDEAAEFPQGTHDDQVDALTQAVLWLRRGAGTRVQVPRGLERDAVLPQSRRRIER